MVTVSKGYFRICDSLIHITILVEHNEEDDPLMPCGDDVFAKSKLIYSIFPGICEYIQNSFLHIDEDDLYEGTIEEANERGKNNTPWKRLYKTLGEEQITVSGYLCQINVFREKFENEYES